LYSKSSSEKPPPEELTPRKQAIEKPTFDFETLLYLVYRHAREADPQTELTNAFKVFDKDGSGRLKISLIHDILRNLKQQPYSEAQINQLLTDLEGVDPESDTLEYEELVKRMIELNC
jgi:calmodulin